MKPKRRKIHIVRERKLVLRDLGSIELPKQTQPYAPNVQLCRLDCLTPHPKQAANFTDVSDGELQARIKSIQKNGVEDPLHILPSGVIVSGHQRARALRSLGWEYVPVIVRHDLAKAGPEAVEAAMIEANTNRRQLTTMEHARAISRLLSLERESRRPGQGEAAEAVARRLGIDRKTVDRLLALLTLPEEVQRLVDKKKLTKQRALVLAKRQQCDIDAYVARLNQGDDPTALFQEMFNVSGLTQTGENCKVLKQFCRWLDSGCRFDKQRDLLISNMQPHWRSRGVQRLHDLLGNLMMKSNETSTEDEADDE